MEKRRVHYINKEISIDEDITKRYIQLKEKQEKINQELKELENIIKEQSLMIMNKNDIHKSFSSNGIKVTYKASYVRTGFDTNRFKEEHLQTYSKYLTTTNVSESLTIGLV